jgi:hypothetical protein
MYGNPRPPFLVDDQADVQTPAIESKPSLDPLTPILLIGIHTHVIGFLGHLGYQATSGGFPSLLFKSLPPAAEQAWATVSTQFHSLTVLNLQDSPR